MMQALWKLAMSYWAQWERSCRCQFDTNKVLDPNGNVTVQLCHSELKRPWHPTEFGDIGPIMSIVSGRAFRALAKRSYLFRIRDNKYKRTSNVCAHCAVTTALTCVILLISRYKYTGHIPHSINCRHFTFSPPMHSESRHTSEIWKAIHCFRTLNCDHWACGFNSFLKKMDTLLARSVRHLHNESPLFQMGLVYSIMLCRGLMSHAASDNHTVNQDSNYLD